MTLTEELKNEIVELEQLADSLAFNLDKHRQIAIRLAVKATA